jgi:hypothetical protein
MPRGGRRQGRPGRAYSNRTDLMTNYAEGSAGGGGIEAPAEAAPFMGPSPEDSPGLLDLTADPSQPITAGLDVGDGPGSEVLMNRDPRVAETAKLKRWLPLLNPIAEDPEAPDSFRTFVRYLRGS